MKYNILGFSQTESLKYGLDLIDLTLLHYFIDFQGTGTMASKIINNKAFYWLDYTSILEEYPILKLKKDTIYRRLKKLCDLNILEHTSVNTVVKNNKTYHGVYPYYAIGPEYICLISDTKSTDKSAQGTDTNPDGYGSKSEGVRMQIRGDTDLNPGEYGCKSGTNIPLLYPSIKDPSININTNDSAPKVKKEYTDDFEKFWAAYPHKIEKRKAFGCWKARLKEKCKVEDLIKAANNYKKCCEINKTEQTYIKYPSTFLGHNKFYEDFIDWQPQQQSNTNSSYKKNRVIPGAASNQRQYDAAELEAALLKRSAGGY